MAEGQAEAFTYRGSTRTNVLQQKPVSKPFCCKCLHMAMDMPGFLCVREASCESEYMSLSYFYTITDMLVLGYCCSSGFGGSLVDPEQQLSCFCILMPPADSCSL